jgi:hypothetical protein
MIEYYIYEVSSGRIVQVGLSEPSFLQSFDKDGLCIKQGCANLTDYFVADGELKKKDEKALIKIRESQLIEDIKFRRREELKDSDWTQLSDAPVDKAMWESYRQKLRDLPTQDGFPYNVVWPKPPA